jgi:hypothetical protein
MTGQASICFCLASFSLYLRRFYHFSFSIKRTNSKSQPPEEIRPKIYEHDVSAYLMGLTEKIQNEPTNLIDDRLSALGRIAYLAIGELSKLEDKAALHPQILAQPHRKKTP